MRTRLILLMGLLLCLGMSAGCTARLGQFKAFADAGTAFVTAEGQFLTASRDAAIDADSAVLIRTRSALPDTAGKDILAQNKQMKERIALLDDIQHHGQLLSAYFQTLSKLAASDAPGQVSTDSEKLLESLGKVRAKIKAATVNGTAISSIVGPTVQLGVQAYQVGVLDAELQKHAQMIASEIALHQQVLKLLAAAYQTDAQELLNAAEVSDVDSPYKAVPGALPAKWADRRKELLVATTSLAAGDAVVTAADKLQKSFTDLVEHKLDIGDLQSMIADLDRLVKLSQALHGVNP